MTVAVVFDRDYGGNLRAVASRVPVWVVESPANRPTIEALWTERRRDRAPYDVTLFRWIDGLTAADHLDGVLRSVRADAGGDQAATPTTIEVIGVAADDDVLRVLDGHGLAVAEATTGGFRACVRRAPA